MSLFATYDEVVATIRTRFHEQIAAIDNLLTVYDNDPTEPPDNINEWVRLTVIGGDGRQVQFGSGLRFRGTGVMVAQVFAPIGVGERRPLKIANKIMERFTSVSTANGIVFLTAYTVRIGREGQYWQINVNCPFRFDRVRLEGVTSA